MPMPDAAETETPLDSEPSPSTTTAPTEGADHGEAHEATPGEVFAIRLSNLITAFGNRQAEVLRMCEHLDDRESDLNDAKQRAKRHIEHAMSEVNEDALDRYLEVFRSLDDNSGHDEAEEEAAFVAALEEIGQDLPDGIEQTYVEAVLRALPKSVGAKFLHSSLLMILVGELEVFINFLARACFEVNPGALEQGDKSFKWSEIAGLETIDDVRDLLVDQTIDNLLRGSMIDWIKFFENRFHLAEVKAARTFESLEAVQRRHCVVHNGGTASQQYLDHLDQFPLDVSVGDPLPVDSAYIARAADTLYLVAYSLTWALGVKLNPEKEWSEWLLTELTNRTMILLQEQRPHVVVRIVESAPLNQMKGEDPEYCALVLRVNRWIALKDLGKFNTVRHEVEQFPVAMLDNSFKLAKMALLEENEAAYDLAQSMIRDGQLKLSHLLTWPLLRGVRQVARNREAAAPENDGGSTEDDFGATLQPNGEDAA